MHIIDIKKTCTPVLSVHSTVVLVCMNKPEISEYTSRICKPTFKIKLICFSTTKVKQIGQK